MKDRRAARASVGVALIAVGLELVGASPERTNASVVVAGGIQLSPAAVILTIGSDHTLSATVLDLTSNPLAQVVVTPSLTINPALGPPGFVPYAVGRGYPPNVKVRLRWSVGLTPEPSEVQTDPEGGFRAPVLVFHHDVLGPRKLVAQAGPNGRAQVAEADYLVVPTTVQPPRFAARR